MLNILSINNQKIGYSAIPARQTSISPNNFITDNPINKNSYKKYSVENLQSYIPSFSRLNKKSALPSERKQIKVIKNKLDNESQEIFNKLQAKGILQDNSSNDGTTVLNNLYKIATEPRINGLSDKLILKEVLNALDNPFSITQKFGDIPQKVAKEIERNTKEKFPEDGYNVASSSCVATSMEFNLASKKPAEFVRFAQGLSSSEYSVTKNLDLSIFAEGPSAGLWELRKFNTEKSVNGNKLAVKIQPDRNAIIRARVQSSYKDPGERSCIDVLIQSAILNLCSQNTYNSLNDERTGEFNNDNHGLTDFEKTFGEQIIFETPKISVVYQELDESGKLLNHRCELSEIKNHILKSLEQGQNVIIGYTHFDSENKVDGGHEITIIGYNQDKDGKGYFICNDTDDGVDLPIRYDENKLLPLIHHAGISRDALSSDDTVIEPWREIIDSFKTELNIEKSK